MWLSEEVGVSAGAGEDEHESAVVYRVQENPVVFDMAVAESREVAGKRMVPVLRGKRFAAGEGFDDGFELADVGAAPYHALEVFAEPDR